MRKEPVLCRTVKKQPRLKYMRTPVVPLHAGALFLIGRPVKFQIFWPCRSSSAADEVVRNSRDRALPARLRFFAASCAVAMVRGLAAFALSRDCSPPTAGPGPVIALFLVSLSSKVFDCRVWGHAFLSGNRATGSVFFCVLPASLALSPQLGGGFTRNRTPFKYSSVKVNCHYMLWAGQAQEGGTSLSPCSLPFCLPFPPPR